jgi:hypothetical protein
MSGCEGSCSSPRHCLEALDLDNPPVADRALSKMDAARALIGDGRNEDDKG